jgi:hypothetical protein
MRNFRVLGVVLAACSSSPRSGEDPDAGDTESDSDTVVSVETGEPIQLASAENIWSVASAYSGSHLAVSWADYSSVEPYARSMELAFVPWLEMDQVIHKHAVKTYPSPHIPFSQVFTIGSGFLVLTYYRPFQSTASVEQSAWSEDAVLTDGFHLQEGYDGYNISPPSGAEDVDQDGRVLTATLAGEDSLTVLFAVDRFGPEGFRETIVSEIFDWSEQAEEHGAYLGGRTLHMGSTFRDGDRVVAFDATELGSVVFAQASLEGEVLVAPKVIAAHPEDYPVSASTRTTKGAAFARKGDRVLGIVELFGNYDGHNVRHYSALFNLEGDLVEGPRDLVPLRGGVAEQDTSWVAVDLVAWGERFAYCYHTSADGAYHLLVLDETGNPLADPFLLDGVRFPAANAACAIEVIDQATLAVIVASAVYPNSILNGPYLIVVTDPALQ